VCGTGFAPFSFAKTLGKRKKFAIIKTVYLVTKTKQITSKQTQQTT
jgi:hypothetical protein